MGAHIALELKDSQIREQVRKIDELEDSCLDLENTINQFRDLVLQLQSYVTLQTFWTCLTQFIQRP